MEHLRPCPDYAKILACDRDTIHRIRTQRLMPLGVQAPRDEGTDFHTSTLDTRATD